VECFFFHSLSVCGCLAFVFGLFFFVYVCLSKGSTFFLFLRTVLGAFWLGCAGVLLGWRGRFFVVRPSWRPFVGLPVGRVERAIETGGGGEGGGVRFMRRAMCRAFLCSFLPYDLL